MKPCKACQIEIPDEAYKCSHCRAFQKWYRNPQSISWLLLIPLFGLLYWSCIPVSLSLKRQHKQKYTQYQSQFTVELVKMVTSDDKKKDAITYKVKNGTDYKWENAKISLIGIDDKGDVVYTKSDTEYGWVIQPKSESFLTVTVEKKWKVKSWEIKLTDLEAPLF